MESKSQLGLRCCHAYVDSTHCQYNPRRLMTFGSMGRWGRFLSLSCPFTILWSKDKIFQSLYRDDAPILPDHWPLLPQAGAPVAPETAIGSCRASPDLGARARCPSTMRGQRDRLHRSGKGVARQLDRALPNIRLGRHPAGLTGKCPIRWRNAGSPARVPAPADRGPVNEVLDAMLIS